MRTTFAIATLALLALTAVPAQASTPLGSGTILLSDFFAPITTTAQEEGIDGFYVDAPAAGTTITSSTVDAKGLGYDIDFRFYDAQGRHIEPQKENGGDPCETRGAEQTCIVPAGLENGGRILVSSKLGAFLEVTVLAV